MNETVNRTSPIICRIYVVVQLASSYQDSEIKLRKNVWVVELLVIVVVVVLKMTAYWLL